MQIAVEQKLTFCAGCYGESQSCPRRWSPSTAVTQLREAFETPTLSYKILTRYGTVQYFLIAKLLILSGTVLVSSLCDANYKNRNKKNKKIKQEKSRIFRRFYLDPCCESETICFGPDIRPYPNFRSFESGTDLTFKRVRIWPQSTTGNSSSILMILKCRYI
jgi:hypothetical protein